MTPAAAQAPLTTWNHDGLTFDVRDSGPLDGPPVLCLHGFPQDGTAYDEVARRRRPATRAGPGPARLLRRGRPAGSEQYGLRHLTPTRSRCWTRPAWIARSSSATTGAGRSPGRWPRGTPTGPLTGGPLDAAPRRTAPGRCSAAARPAVVVHGAVPAAVPPRGAAHRCRWPGARAGAATVGPAGRRGAALRRAAARAGRCDGCARLVPGTGLAASAGGRAGWRARRRTWSGGTTRSSAAPPCAHRRTGHAPYQRVELDAGHWLPEQEPGAVVDAVLRQVHASSVQRGF